MSNEILILTSYGKDCAWDSGDPMITEGIFNLLPELREQNIIYQEDIADVELEYVVSQCKYIIQAGTPSWMILRMRKIWSLARKYNKRISFLGIGLAVSYYQQFWYGTEDFVNLRDAGIIDVIVCRDKHCYYWLHKKLGVDTSKICILPCPAFYSLPPNVSKDKINVVVSIPNPEETSKETSFAFQNIDTDMYYMCNGLENSGAKVSCIYQRNKKFYGAFIERAEKILQREVACFENYEEFKNFMSDKQVYVGYRNHGAIPMAGAGNPALLLGTDLRQMLADEIPFISRHDISHIGCTLTNIFDWYGALNPEGVGYSCLNYRNTTYERWRERLIPVIEGVSK